MGRIQKELKLGLACTRRDIFSKEDAKRYKNKIREKLDQMKIQYVDLEWLNEEGLLYDGRDVPAVARKFGEENIDALFVPHCNFGSEASVLKLAKSMNKPLLLWGPRDERPLPDGMRLRDSQCGLFATSKALVSAGVPFTYLENCRLEDRIFEQGVQEFMGAVAVVKSFYGMRIGQIDVRPESFLSVMCNERQLYEKFGIEIVPVALNEIVRSMQEILDSPKVLACADELKARISGGCADKDAYRKIAALKLSIKNWADCADLSGVAIQCWSALQDLTGIMPCVANAELTQEFLPVVCETDLCGAITAVMAQAAVRYATPVFFADLTVRHPDNDNAELLWHCGPFPHSLKKENCSAKVGRHYILDSACPGVAEWEIKGGDITVCRFDAAGSEYSMLVAKGKGIDGPFCRGTYVWVEFSDWPALERKIITGPYIHHVAGVHGDIARVMEEAARYLPGVKMDFFR